MNPTPRSIRGLDPELVKQARIEALKQGVSLGKWLNEAIAIKLERLRAYAQIAENEKVEISICQHPI